MEIVTTQCEDLLVEMLSLIETNPDQWMSLHVNISPMHSQTLNREGLSKATLMKIHQMSTQLAHKLNQYDLLYKFEGKIMVFEDGDVLALFLKDSGPLVKALDNVRSEFIKANFIHILMIQEMKEKMKQLIILSEEKKKTAEEYRMKQRAVEMGENLLAFPEQDPEIALAIQKKRRMRPSSCVLVIEDDRLMRGLVVSMLKDKHEVVQAKDAVSGITAYIDLAPNVVLLDIKLPGLKGSEILKRLVRLDPEAYIIMLSGYSSSDNVISTHSDGAAGFLCKPFSKEKLYSYIKQCPSAPQIVE